MSGIRVHPPPPLLKPSARPEIALPRGPARGSLSPAPTCLYLLYSGYRRHRPQRAGRSDKRVPPSPEWVPRLPPPLSESLFCTDLRPDSGPNRGGAVLPGGREDPAPHRLCTASAARPRASPARRRWGRPRLYPAHARHPFLSPCGSARLYLRLWWCTHFCRDIYRDSGCTLFSVLRKNFSGALFRHPRLNAPHPLNPTKKAEGETSWVKGRFSWPQTNGLVTERQN